MASPPENKPGEAADKKPSDEKVPERKPSEKAQGGKPSAERLERKSSQDLKERQPGERPHFRICYLCKREFGSQRLFFFFTLQPARYSGRILRVRY